MERNDQFNTKPDETITQNGIIDNIIENVNNLSVSPVDVVGISDKFVDGVIFLKKQFFNEEKTFKRYDIILNENPQRTLFLLR